MKTNKRNKKEEKYYYHVAFRWKVVQQLEAEQLTELQACEKYGITRTLIRQWRKQYYQRKLLPYIKPKLMKSKKSQTDQINALKARIKALEEQNEQLRIEAYAHKTMVEIAEKEFQIPIRKKSGVKQ